MPKKPFVPLARIYDPSNNFEMGIDECARGPLFGRLYVAATILPKNEDFRHDEMKDSKKIKSRTKMRELSDYIKEHAIAWHIHFIEADVIDEINIRQAVLRGMKECIKQVLLKVDTQLKTHLSLLMVMTSPDIQSSIMIHRLYARFPTQQLNRVMVNTHLSLLPLFLLKTHTMNTF